VGDRQTDRQTETPYQYRRVIETRDEKGVAKGTKQSVNFSRNFQSEWRCNYTKTAFAENNRSFVNSADDILQTGAKLGKFIKYKLTIIGIFSHCNVKRIALNESYHVRNAIIRRSTRSSADADNRLDAFSGQSRSTNIWYHSTCYILFPIVQ